MSKRKLDDCPPPEAAPIDAKITCDDSPSNGITTSLQGNTSEGNVSTGNISVGNSSQSSNETATNVPATHCDDTESSTERERNDVDQQNHKNCVEASSVDGNSIADVNAANDLPEIHDIPRREGSPRSGPSGPILAVRGGQPHNGDATADSGRSRKRKKVVFNGVRVYYFSRSQGFTCVPSQGGSTLGMGEQHSHCEEFSIKDHAKNQRQLHKVIIEEHKRLGKLPHTPKRPKLEEGKAESESEESDLEVDDYYFLQPLSTRQRRMLLRSCGVKKIEPVEKEECRGIRQSRELCGCTCKLYCDPRTCSCSLAGIKCQVDRLSFPCGCSLQQNCHNPSGRIEFNPVRVRTHFLHTLMRLELEETINERTGLGEFNSTERGSCRDCQISDATGENSGQTMDIMQVQPGEMDETVACGIDSDSCSDQSSSEVSTSEQQYQKLPDEAGYSCKLDTVPGISEMLAPIHYPDHDHSSLVGQRDGNNKVNSNGNQDQMEGDLTHHSVQDTTKPQAGSGGDGADMIDVNTCWSSEEYCYNQQLANIIESGACYESELIQNTTTPTRQGEQSKINSNLQQQGEIEGSGFSAIFLQQNSAAVPQTSQIGNDI